MLNFGLSDLRLVDPTAHAQSDEAVLRASGAAPILRRCETHETAADAVADLQLVLATTARPRESRIPVYAPREAMALAAAAIARGERVGLMFGSEKNGLSNAELDAANAIVTIPTFPGFSSLNLAQAVLLVCYEWGAIAEGENQYEVARQAYDADEAAAEAEGGSGARAPLGQVDSLLRFWEERLWEANFFGGNRALHSQYGPEEGRAQERSRAAAAMAKLRRLVLRAQPSKGEASLLRGSLQALVVPKGGGRGAVEDGGGDSEREQEREG